MVTTPQTDPAARRARGRAARESVPRRAQAEWHRADEGRARTGTFGPRSRSGADLLPLRYERMSASPWTYFRGAAAVMAADLAGCPHTGLTCSCAATPTS